MNERNPASADRADLLGQGGQNDQQKAAQDRAQARQSQADEAAEAEKARAEEKAKADAQAAEQRAAQEQAEAEARAAAEKVAADQAAEAEKVAAEQKALADLKAAQQRAATKAAKKPARARRGPPADGGSEDRQDAILTTSKLSSTEGEKLRRGMVVSVPARRLAHLERAGRIRLASSSELEIAERRYGRAQLK